MTKRRHTTPWFWIGFGLYTLALLTAIAVGLNVVTEKLARYEHSLPSHAAETVFADFFSEDASRALDEYPLETGEYETKEQAKAAVQSLVHGKQLRFFESSARDDEHHYTVACDDTRIAEFSLSPAEKKGLWRLDGIDFSLKPEQTVCIRANKESTVFLNGIAVPHEEAAAEDKSHFSHNHMLVNADSDPVAEGVTFVEYEIGGLYRLPEVTVKDRRGRSCEVTEKNGIHTETLLYDDDRLNEVASAVLPAAEEYCLYMHRSTSYGSLGNYFDKTCTFYKDLRHASIYDNLYIDTYEFVTEEISELYFYGDTVFSCFVHIDEDVVPVKTGKHTTYTTDFRLYFRYVEGKGWRVYDVSFTKDS